MVRLLLVFLAVVYPPASLQPAEVLRHELAEIVAAADQVVVVVATAMVVSSAATVRHWDLRLAVLVPVRS